MRLNKFKKVGVLALMLIPLSLSGCKKGEEVEGDQNGGGVAIEGEVTQEQEQVVTEPTPEPAPEYTPPTFDFEFDGVEDKVLPKDAEIHFIPVGLGESVLFRDHSDYLLVDAGGNKGATINYLKDKGVKKLKYLVLTQWDNDSLTDVEGILNTFQIDYIIAPEIQATAHKDAEVVKKVLSDKGLNVSEPKERKVDYKIGESTFSLLNRIAKNSVEDDNSLGVYINIGGTKVFISSDASTNQEEVKQLGDIDIYSVAKHGDKIINTEERINILKPEFSIIPTKENSPIDFSNTEKLLKDIGSKVLKTTEGAIVLKITDDGISSNR